MSGAPAPGETSVAFDVTLLPDTFSIEEGLDGEACRRILTGDANATMHTADGLVDSEFVAEITWPVAGLLSPVEMIFDAGEFMDDAGIVKSAAWLDDGSIGMLVSSSVNTDPDRRGVNGSALIVVPLDQGGELYLVADWSAGPSD